MIADSVLDTHAPQFFDIRITFKNLQQAYCLDCSTSLQPLPLLTIYEVKKSGVRNEKKMRMSNS